MIILIAGASHTGKTVLAQKLLEKYKYPYLSIDHLKMGLIRRGNTELTPVSDETKDIKRYARVIEERLEDESCMLESVLEDNAHTLELVQKNKVPYILIDDEYNVDVDIINDETYL